MKTKRVPPPLQIALLFAAFAFCFSINLNAQTFYDVNGKTLMLNNGKYIDVTTPDSMEVDTRHVTIKFKTDQKTTGISNLQTAYSVPVIGSTEKDFIDFVLPLNADYIDLITDIEKEDYIDNFAINHFLMPHTKPLPNDPGSISAPMSEDHAWYLYLLSLLDAWEISTGDPSVKIALIDDGFYTNDLDIINDQSLNWNAVTLTNNVTPVGQSHGTSMSSIIASRTNNSLDMFGIAGGWSGAGGCNTFMVSIGQNFQEWAIDDAIYKAVTNGARVINMSWGGIGWYNSSVKAAIDFAYEEGVVMFASVGNSNNNVAWPATDDNVIAVGGVNDLDQRWHLAQQGSCFGPETEISTIAGRSSIASELGVYYKWIANTVEYDDTKTSGASAMASAIAGLILSVNPCLTPDEVRTILIQSCEKVGGYNYNWNLSNPGHSKELGYGRVNAFTALQLAANLVQPGEIVTQDKTYDTPKYFSSNVVVKNNATLTVNTTVKFAKNTALIVEKGGRLVLTGTGKLTSLCNELWDGVIVHGNPALPQYPSSNQGKFEIGGGTIEKATTGIRLCIPLPSDNPTGWANEGGGGILLAVGAQIVSCITGISFAPYPYDNISSLDLSAIKMTALPDDIPFYAGMLLNGLNGLTIKGVEFLNYNYSLWYTGYGIYSFNSKFTTDYYCMNQDNSEECEEVFRLKNTFQRFRYGIYAENVGANKFVKINYCSFEMNKYGMYGSALILPEIEKNAFIAYDNPDLSYCLYLNNCDQYSIEANTFTGDPYHLHEDIGLYIRNSGPQNNEVYSNTFQNLKYAAVADGYNRYTPAQTGLCFKCNDFITCTNDILVPLPDPPLVNVNYSGIRPYQGTPGSLNTDAAGNTFSSNGTLNYANYLNPIVYVYHEFKTPSTAKIIPDPRTVNTVALLKNNNTTYSKSVSCPSHLQSDDKEELWGLLSEANAGIQTAQTQLEAFTDGGNTEELNNEVQAAQSSSSYPLYVELMATSPYLSDTVLKSGIENTAALPDVMLRDVLVANPQSAKSGDVMQALDERTVPMPDEMKEEVQEGINVFASYDNMQGNIALWTDRWSNANTGLARIFATDTISNRATDSLAALYNSTNTKDAKYNLALLETARGNFQLAQTTLASISNSYNLKNDELIVHDNYVTLVNNLSNLMQSDFSLLSADSASLSTLLPLAESDNFLPGANARNILHAAGYLEYIEPININVSLKSAKAKNPEKKLKGDTKITGIGFEVYPNPATEYCIVNYACEAESDKIIRITDLQGKLIASYPIKGKQSSKVIPLKSCASGTYLISLISNGKLVNTTQLIVR
jgi:hypothetical protein